MKNEYPLNNRGQISFALFFRNTNPTTHARKAAQLMLLCMAILAVTTAAAQPVYLDGSLIKTTPYGYPGLSGSLRDQLNAIKNADATALQETGLWERANAQLAWFRANYHIGHGGLYFENEKASYPYAMYHLMYGMANNNASIVTSAKNHLQGNDPHLSSHTDYIDLFPSFTLKGQMPKYFYFGKHAGALDGTYMTRMFNASDLWSDIDPLNRPSPHYTGGCSGWDAKCKNSWVDVRNTDNLKAMRESAVYLLAEETGNTAVRDLYFNRIRDHAATLYHKGYSEWDSENYFSHSLAPWLNLYTYTIDPDMKKLAKAAVDWYMMAGAAKYYRGTMAGPSKRLNANANVPVSIDAASALHVYFGDHAIPAGVDPHDRDTYISMLSTYRPPQAIYELAAKQFPAYVEQINSKPQYGIFTPTHSSSPSAWETMFYGQHYAMGSVVTASEVGDMRAFKLVASNSTRGSDAFYAYSTGTGSLVHYKRGGDQLSQYRNLMIFLRAGGSQFGFQAPATATFEQDGGVWFFRLEKTWIAIKPINITYGSATPMTGVYANEVNHLADPVGTPAYSGYAMEVGDEGQSSYAAFKTAVKARTLDLSELASGTVRVNGADGYLKTQYNSANDRPLLYRNSEEIYDFYAPDDINHSVYRAVTPPLADLTSAAASGTTVSMSVTASDPLRGLISEDYQKGTLRVITNNYVFTSTVTTSGEVTYSEEPVNANNVKGALKAVEFYAGTEKVGEVTNPTILASGNITFDWTSAPNGNYSMRAKAIDEEGNATWSNAREVTVTGGAQPPQQLVTNPVADAYVKDGSDAGVNFGADTYLITKANSGARRESYLKFDLSSVTGPITEGKLRVYGRLINTNTPSVATAVYPSADTTWAELGINFNNRPGVGSTALSSVNVAGVSWTWYEWDVAAYLEAERAAGRRIVTLVMVSTVNSDPYGWFESRENSNKPQLSLTYTPDASGPGTGLSATYYDNIDFTGSTVSRIDPQVNFTWGSGSPDPAIDVNTFSARWTGRVKADYSETYTFYTRTDDGVRLWVNGQQLVDRWVNQSPSERSGSIALTAGQQYDIVMEYYENTGGAVAELRWSSPSTPKAFIPTVNLYPDEQESMMATFSLAPAGSEVTAEEALRVYPNPAANLLTISFHVEKPQPTQVEFFDQAVQRRYQMGYDAKAGNNQVTLDVSAFPQGLYLVRVRGRSFSQLKKVMVTR